MNAKKFCIVASVLSCAFAHAVQVSPGDAREAVAGWAALGDALTGAAHFGGAQIAKVETFEGADGMGVFHVVSFDGGGFAVTSGDTEITPILAYSDEGEFVASDGNPLWAMLARDVAGRARNLADGNAPSAPKTLLASSPSPRSSESASAWERLRAAAAPTPPGKNLLKRTSSISEVRVAPLCKTRWNQSGNGENKYTPRNISCGCVATAMAQVMKVFEWPKEQVHVGDRWYVGLVQSSETPWYIGLNPTTGVRYTVENTSFFEGPEFGGPYDWANMPDLPSQIVNDTQRSAIGQLTRDCGIACKMQYYSDGSGSSSNSGRLFLALTGQFGYTNAVFVSGNQYLKFDDPNTAHAVRAAMLGSYNMGLPCIASIPNHCIVGDGYGYSGSNLYLHFNWGWGTGSQTAWYVAGSEFPQIKELIYNIYTPEICDEPKRTIVSGRVLDGGRPVAGIAVTARDQRYPYRTFETTTGENGIYAMLLPYGRDYDFAASNSLKVASRNGVKVYRFNRSQIVRETDQGTVAYDEPGMSWEVTNLIDVDMDLEYDDGIEHPWLDERAENTKWTGTWASPVVYGADGRAELYGDNAFSPFNCSTGNVVTVEFKTVFDEVVRPSDPGEDAQAAIRLSTNGSFQVWTRTETGGAAGGPRWIDVAAEGLAPQSGEEYTLRFALDYLGGTYSVAAGDARFGTGDGTTDFPLAFRTNGVSSVAFMGETVFTSLLGEDTLVVTGFLPEEVVLLKDNANVVLDAAMAEWLNKCAGGDKAAAASAASRLTEDDFGTAYLLNVDIAGDSSYSFEVTKVDVGGDCVTVEVTLTRPGKVDQKINGVLKFYGADTVSAFRNNAAAPVAAEDLTNENFADGDTASVTFQKTEGSFFNAKIEKAEAGK